MHGHLNVTIFKCYIKFFFLILMAERGGTKRNHRASNGCFNIGNCATGFCNL